LSLINFVTIFNMTQLNYYVTTDLDPVLFLPVY